MSLNPPPAPRLTDQTRAALELAQALVERDMALLALADVLNPDRKLSTWAFAAVVEDRISRFEIARHRIEAGSREPRNDTERALLALYRGGCPSSQRRLWDLLVELRI